MKNSWPFYFQIISEKENAMAIKRITNENRYFGLSSDIKSTTGITEGSTLLLIDTDPMEKYVFFDGMWEVDTREGE